MYPPTQYSRLPTDPEGGPLPALGRKRFFNRRLLRPLSIGLAVVFFVSVVAYASKNHLKDVQVPFVSLPPKVEFPNNTFIFDQGPRPTYLDTPPKKPLVLRIAVISRIDEFERRQTLRDTILNGVPESEVQFVYRFFLGANPEGLIEGSVTNFQLSQEKRKHNDIVVFEDILDIPERLSEKRYSALKWAGEAHHDSYDYFMTIDSDTFCRYGVLSRRLEHLYTDKDVKPREQPILIGRMGSHLTYFQNTVADGNKNATLEDEFVKGPWFPYPIGIGYMLSSSLVNTILSADPSLPHHIHYPSDDVMIGAWVAGLKYFPDPTIEFETTAEHSPEPVHRVYPKPYFPHVVDTNIIDELGWHNFPGRGGPDDQISWDSVCIHRLSAPEMRAFKEMEEIRGEWKKST
ncbi:galactosyltransferase-domain-containing protein [Crucibulum laeve]|uniref:Hexosyltransferase n=1 Tax=Crucibulum laeve TaxID=68775 RepID=A0A5C3M136_9AGAR|nr:galactosyltransferase-domain-containing protein [Crucibulum laeve]